ncbi:MAG: CapA family protein [Clostridiales bacterium]|nr:CapA family protein [Clostridiales bacterium]
MKSRIEILIAGDFCPIGRTGQAIIDGRSNEMIKDIRTHIDSADISVVNLEAPLSLGGSPIEKTGPNIQADPRCVDFLLESKFSLINTANNHIYDFGEESFAETEVLLDENKLRHVGSGMNIEEAVKESIFEIKGSKVVFLAFAENEYTIATKNSGGAAPVDFVENIRQINRVSDENDLTVVMVHGGNEYDPIPSPKMKKRYRGYIDAGASAVVAMHTHCPQGYEMYNGCPVVYSLGNFLFDTPYPDRKTFSKDDFWWKGYMVRLTFDNNKTVGIEPIPIDFGPDGTRVMEISGEEKIKFLNYLDYISGVIGDNEEVQKYWEAWCMMKGPWWVEHFNKLKYPVNRDDSDQRLAALVVRNGHTCEAHNEIITTFMRLIAHGKDKGHEEYIIRIEKLQKGIFLKT